MGILHEIILSNVVLPAPEAPIIAVTSPPLAIPDMPLSIYLVYVYLLHGKEHLPSESLAT